MNDWLEQLESEFSYDRLMKAHDCVLKSLTASDPECLNGSELVQTEPEFFRIRWVQGRWWDIRTKEWVAGPFSPENGIMLEVKRVNPFLEANLRSMTRSERLSVRDDVLQVRLVVGQVGSYLWEKPVWEKKYVLPEDFYAVIADVVSLVNEWKTRDDS